MEDKNLASVTILKKESNIPNMDGELSSSLKDEGNGVTNGSSNPSDYGHKLFVGGLSCLTTQDKLKEYFSKFGPVTNVLIMMDPITRRNRGFGFITFADPTIISKVLAIPFHILDGKRIDPKHATPMPKYGSNKTKKVFVGGVSQDTKLEEVTAYFSQFGKVEEAVLLPDNLTKRHRGFGFVTFESEDVVDKICKIHFHMIMGKKVECKTAQPRKAVTCLDLVSTAQPQSISTLAAAATVFPYPPNAVANYLKMLGGGLNHPFLGNCRYSPYPHFQHFNTTNDNGLRTYSSAPVFAAYALPASVDVSGLENFDWSGAYNTIV